MWMLLRGAPAYWHSSSMLLCPHSAQLATSDGYSASQPRFLTFQAGKFPASPMWLPTAFVQPAVAPLQCRRAIVAHTTRPTAKPCGALMPVHAFPRRDSARECP